MPTVLQKLTAQAIVNVFETGRPRGDNGKVTLIPGDPGRLTYGRSQTTLASGNLDLLIKAYCGAAGAALTGALRRYLSRLAARDPGLDRGATPRRLLERAAMRGSMPLRSIDPPGDRCLPPRAGVTYARRQLRGGRRQPR